MCTSDEIPKIWLDIPQIESHSIYSQGCEQESTVSCALCVMGEYYSATELDYDKSNLNFNITKFFICKDPDLELFETNAIIALVSRIEISEEDWIMYQDGHDVRFDSSRPVPVIIYKSSPNLLGKSILSILGSGLVDEEFIKLTRNFL